MTTKVNNRMIDGAPANILDFGADPTGVIDSTQAIAAALSSNHTVYLPEGEYKVTATITIPDSSTVYGAGKYSTFIKMETTQDIDVIQIGWYTSLKDMSIWQDNNFAVGGGLSNGVVRMQSLTNSEIPPDWVAKGGLSYYNTIENVELKYGQNYNLYCANGAYNDLINIRSVLSKGPSGNCFLYAHPDVGGTTTNVRDCKFISAWRGQGLGIENYNSMSVTGVISEGNYGRGLLINDCTAINVDNCYLENNFALGAPTGDGDIVVVDSLTISIVNTRILGNNSTYGISSSNTTNSSLIGGWVTRLGGLPIPLLIPNWQWSQSATAIDLSEEDGDWKYSRFSDGTVSMTLNRKFTGQNITAAVGNIFVSNSPIVITDFPISLVSDGALGFKMEYSCHIVADNGEYLWCASGGSSELNNAIRVRPCSPVSNANSDFTLQVVIRAYWR